MNDSDQSKRTAAVDFPFRVRDQRKTSLDYEVGFAGLRVNQLLSLGLQLVEIDHGFTQYKKCRDVIVGNKGGLLEIAQGIPYVELAAKIVDGFASAFGADHSDQTWDASPALAVNPSVGAAFLRSGIYVAYENDRSDMQFQDVLFEDRRLVDARPRPPRRTSWWPSSRRKDDQLRRNYLTLSIQVT